MNIVVLAKPVPDPAATDQRLDRDGRLIRAGVPTVINGNDEYALEAGLRLVEAHGGQVTLLAMAPSHGIQAIRRGLAMGAHRAVLVTDEALAGSCVVSTARVLAAAIRTLDHDLVLAGVDTSDGQGGFIGPGVATLLGVPYMGYASRLEPDPVARSVRVHRIGPHGYTILEGTMPALIGCTQALGEPRYPSLRAVMGARMKEIATLSLADLGFNGATVGGNVATTRVLATRPPGARAATRVVDGTAAESARAIFEFLVERQLI